MTDTFLERGITIKSDRYSATTDSRCNAASRQRPTTHHPSNSGASENFGWTVLPYLPYIPDLASSDYYLFPMLTERLCGQSFRKDDEIKEEICNIGIQKLELHPQK